MFLRPGVGFCALALVGLASPAAAQSVAPAATTPTETVVVTGRRPANDKIVVRRSTGGALFGEADLREVPFSVNIVGEAEIENRQATTLGEMLSTDPSIGFEYQDAGGMPFDRLSIRGFTQSNQVVNGQLTGLDVIAAGSATVDRVEVLRGPSAFRYGFVNPGGVVNIVTKRPTTRPETTLSLKAAADSQFGLHLDHSSHFDAAARFGYRVNVLASSGDVPIETQRRRQSVVAVATDFRLTNDLTLYADLQQSDILARGGNSVFPNIQVATDGRALAPIDPGRTVQPAWGRFETPSLSGGIEIDQRLSSRWRLNSMFRHIGAEDRGYGGVSFYDPFQPNGDFVLANYGYRNEYQTFSNVTFAQGVFDVAGAAHKLTIGFSVLNADLKGFEAQNNNTSRLPSNLYQPAELPFTEPGPYQQTFRIREKQRGWFVSDEMSFGRWRPLLGVRYSKLEYDATFDPLPSRNDKVSPMVALSFDASDVATVYASYSTGLENGGLAPIGTTNANAQMPPLQTKGYEVGVKTDLMGGAVTLDAALFQARKTAAFTDAGGTYVQSGHQVHTGFEMMAKGRWWKPLEFSAGVTYIDAVLDGDPATDGSRPVNVPRWSIALYGDYAVAAIPGLHLSGQVNHRSSREYNLPNRNQVPGYAVFGLGARYATQIAGHPGIFRLNIDNLSNKAYYKMIDTFGGTLGAPRTVKASLELRFE
jgi:iron complex outermembrane recepter protein